MAPCPPLTYVEGELWSNVKRDSTNIIVLQASAVREAWSAAFGSGSGEGSYRIVVMGDDGLPLGMVATAETLAEGEKDWEWAVGVYKAEFRRKTPTQHKIIEHFVAVWNKSHPRNMAIPYPQWRKETKSAEIEMKEMRELMQSADSETNILDSVSFRVLHIIEFLDGNGYPQFASDEAACSTTPPRGVRSAQKSPSDQEMRYKMYEAALNTYRLPVKQPSHLPGYHHCVGEAYSDNHGFDKILSFGSTRGGPPTSRPLTTMFQTSKSGREKKRKSFNAKDI